MLFFNEAPRLPRARQELRLTRAMEGGTTDRALLEGHERFRVSENFSVDGGVGLSAFDQAGLSLVGVSAVGHFINARADLILSLQHERWSGWQVSENRAELLLDFHPLSFIGITYGLAFRAPVYSSTTLGQALSWSSPDPEFQIVYRFDWDFVRTHAWGDRPLQFGLLIWNLDHFRLYTATNVHFTLEARYGLTPQLALSASGGTAIKGLSGGVVSWGQNFMTLGVIHEL